jgi:FMN-dependent NADH-azoreductase
MVAGGVYSRDPNGAYVRQFLYFIGITDIEFVRAEGLQMGDAPRAAALASASQAIEQHTAEFRKVA